MEDILGYFAFMCVMLIAYVGVIAVMEKMKNKALFNFIFAVAAFVPYVILMAVVYSDVGADDWNFRNTLPTANVSPFMFSMVPLISLLSGKARKYASTLIALLTLGMILSPCFGCIYNMVINYKFHEHFLLDYFAHFALSLWGIYLVKTGQVDLNVRECVKGGAIIVGAATFMLIHNVIFDTAFFGLSLSGKHTIYNQVLVDNSYLSALLYYVGLVGIMVLGYIFVKIVISLSDRASKAILDENKEKSEVL